MSYVDLTPLPGLAAPPPAPAGAHASRRGPARWPRRSLGRNASSGTSGTVRGATARCRRAGDGPARPRGHDHASRARRRCA